MKSNKPQIVRSLLKSLIFATCAFTNILPVIAPSDALAANEFDLYVKTEKFTWKEFWPGYQLKESGYIHGIGFSAKQDVFEHFTIKSKDEFFMGSVDYDGYLQDGGTFTPYKTDTDYKGFKIEVDGGWKIIEDNESSFEAFIGAGGKRWARDLTGVHGYEETWTTIYSRLGIRGDHTSSNQVKTFVEAGVILPIHNDEEIDFSRQGFGTVTVAPGKKASFFAETGLQWKAAKASIFYEGMRFSKSDTVLGLYQPESEADMFGLNIGMTF